MAKSKKYMETVKLYRQLAKKADQRLVRLEKLSQQEHFKGVKKFAYARAQRDIRSWSGENARRFNTAPPKTIQALNAKIADIRNFLESKTSTKRDIQQTYGRQAAGWNKRFGTDFSPADLETYYNRGIAQKLQKKFGYNAHKAIAYIKENERQIIKDIKASRTIDVNVDDDVEEEAIRNILRYYRKDLKKLGLVF